jgi:fluoroacetyl-CoA thioesterase
LAFFIDERDLMRPGLKIGESAEVRTVVTTDMFARFEGETIHPTYSTVSMVYHMEWASRKIILPYLEEQEEGMGGAVSVKHLSPAPKGTEIKITAEVSDLWENVVITKVVAKKSTTVIGVGEVKQVILPKDEIKKMLQQE